MNAMSQDARVALLFGFVTLFGTGLYLYVWYSISPRARRRAAR